MRHLYRDERPAKRVLVLRDRRAEADLDAGADWEIDRHHGNDRRRAVAVLRAKLDLAIACRDDEEALRCEDGPSDYAQAVAKRATHRQSQQLGRDHWPVDTEEPGDLFRRTFDSAAVILDEVAAVWQFADADAGFGVERVIGQLLQDQTAELALRHASLLLQSLDGAEAGPVGSLKHFQNFDGWLAC